MYKICHKIAFLTIQKGIWYILVNIRSLRECKNMVSTHKNTENTGRMGSVQIICAIFDAFAREGTPCSVSRLETLTHIPKSTLYKFMRSLVDIGFVSRWENKRYFVGAKIPVYGDLYYGERPHLIVLKDAISELAKQTGCTTQLCTCIRNKYMVVGECVPESEYAIRSEVLAQHAPITWTASGRLLLQFKTREQIFRGLPKEDLKMPDNSPINLDGLLSEMAQAKKQNFFQYQSPLNMVCTCMASLVEISDEQRYTICVSLPNRSPIDIFADAKQKLLETSFQVNMLIRKRNKIYY